ncbi:hypothetical protein ACOME3_007737 [Neoechinorhynchus agilis]
MLRPEIVHLNVAIIVVILTGGLSLALMSKFWNYTVLVGTQRHSIPLLLLATCLGLVDNCSMIIFYPYTKLYPQVYLSALLVGESLTGFIPAILKLIQGGAEPYCELNGQVVNPLVYFDHHTASNHSVLVEKYTEPRFSVNIFFGCLAFIMGLCLLAFIIMEYVPKFKKIQIRIDDQGDKNERERLTANSIKNEYQMKPFIFWELMLLLAILAFLLWGLMSSLYTYTILPYGFKTANNVIIIANAIRFSAVILAYKKPTKNLLLLNIYMLLVILLGVYLVFIAFYSPCPPLVDTSSGTIVAASCLIMVDYLSSYVKACILRLISFTPGNGLITSAMVMKISVLAGVLTGMYMVDHLRLFHARLFCLPLKAQCLGYRTRFL